MLRTDSDTIADQVLEETLIAERLAAPATRLAGLCTLIALVGWIVGCAWSAGFVGQRIVLNNFSNYFGFQMELQDSSPNGNHSALNDPPFNVDDVEDPVAEGLRLLEEHRRSHRKFEAATQERLRERRLEFNAGMERMMTVQGGITVGWIVVMIMTGVFMLCAALSGLAGSHGARKWHRLVVYWSIFATACTLGAMLALVKWGGFPPIPDLWILAHIAGVQLSYAAVVVIALIATHRSAVSD